MFFEKESPIGTRIRDDIHNHNVHDSYDRKPLNEEHKIPNDNNGRTNNNLKR